MHMRNLIIIKSICDFDAVSRQFEWRASDGKGLTSELIEYQANDERDEGSGESSSLLTESQSATKSYDIMMT